MRDRGAFVFRHEAAAPLVRAEGFRLAARPYFYAAITDHDKLQSVRWKLAQRVTQIVRRAFQPVEEHIDTDQFLTSVRSFFDYRFAVNFFDVFLPVTHGL